MDKIYTDSVCINKVWSNIDTSDYLKWAFFSILHSSLWKGVKETNFVKSWNLKLCTQ
jgi:hypothetical protein